jgi:hypothetical protein
MTTAQWALVISAVAVAISLANLWWSIRLRFMHPKPRIAVRLHTFTVGGAIDPEGWRVDNSPLALGRGCGRNDRGEVVDAEGRRVPVATVSFGRVTFTNFGPNDAIISDVVVSRKRRWRRARVDSIDPNGLPFPEVRYVLDFLEALPIKLEVGAAEALEFPLPVNSLDGIDRLGVLDTFERVHWCSRRQVEDLRKHLSALRG